jgi:hypothetical protein
VQAKPSDPIFLLIIQMEAPVMVVALLVIECNDPRLGIEAVSDQDREIFLKTMPHENWVLS